MNRRPLLITGMHRSGTSLLARFAHGSGVDMGRDLLGPLPSNPFGHFEDADFVAFHREILRRETGGDLWVTAPPPTTAADRGRAEALVAARVDRAIWGWKDPRTTLFLGFWLDLLPDATILFVVRHPWSVLDSLARRHGRRAYRLRSHNRYLRTWLAYNRHGLALREREPARCVLVILEEAIADPGPLARALQKRLAHPFEPARFAALYDATALRSRRFGARLCAPDLLARCVAFYARLRRSAGG